MRERRCEECSTLFPDIRAHAKKECPLKVNGKRVLQPVEPVKGKGKRLRPLKEKCDLDLDLLQCPICTDFFSPPVYQCENGHATCERCCQKLTKGCPSCRKPIGIRCITIEKIMESLTIGCKNAPHGCSKMLKCIERADHEKNCEYKPN